MMDKNKDGSRQMHPGKTEKEHCPLRFVHDDGILNTWVSAEEQSCWVLSIKVKKFWKVDRGLIVKWTLKTLCKL